MLIEQSSIPRYFLKYRSIKSSSVGNKKKIKFHCVNEVLSFYFLNYSGNIINLKLKVGIDQRAQKVKSVNFIYNLTLGSSCRVIHLRLCRNMDKLYVSITPLSLRPALYQSFREV